MNHVRANVHRTDEIRTVTEKKRVRYGDGDTSLWQRIELVQKNPILICLLMREEIVFIETQHFNWKDPARWKSEYDHQGYHG